MKANFYQYRNFRWTYLFIVKNSGLINLRIFNIAQSRVFKCSISANTFSRQNGKLNMPLITKNLPTEYRIPEKYKTCGKDISTQPFYRQLLENIKECAAEIFAGKIFIDPIFGNALKDPVIDSMGHTFEKKSINEWVQKKTSLCPLARHRIQLPLIANTIVKTIMDSVRRGIMPTIPSYEEPVIDEHGRTYEKAVAKHFLGGAIDGKVIKVLIPNRMIRDFLAENRMRMIPNFSLFKERNPKYASHWLTKALRYEKKQKYSYALECYMSAFKYTASFKYYSHIPALFEKIGEYDKMTLAYLYLAKYQLDGGALEKALDTFELLKNSTDSTLDINPILIGLYAFMNRLQQATDLLTKSLKTPLNKTLTPYNDILERCASLHYYKLASLVASPKEKAHILYKGVLDTLSEKRHSEMAILENQAKLLNSDSFLDRLVLFEVGSKKVNIAQEILFFARRLQAKAQWKEMLTAYNMLFESKYDPIDLRNKFYAYTKLGKKEKAKRYFLQYVKSPIDIEEKKNFAQTLAYEKLWEESVIVYDMLPESECDSKEYRIKYRACVALGNTKKAREALLQFIKMEEDRVYILGMPLTPDDSALLFDNIPSTLKSLYCSDVDSKKFIQHLCRLPKTVESLDIGRCNIGDEEAKIVAQNLPTKLRELCLDDNRIGNSGFKALVQKLPASLCELSLRGNRIKDDGVLALVQQITSLKYLRLNRNFLRDTTRYKIRDLSPHYIA